MDPKGRYGFTAMEASAALAELSIYTNAESCPMCASAIRWGGFKEYVYGTSIETLIKKGEFLGLIDVMFKVLIRRERLVAD